MQWHVALEKHQNNYPLLGSVKLPESESERKVVTYKQPVSPSTVVAILVGFMSYYLKTTGREKWEKQSDETAEVKASMQKRILALNFPSHMDDNFDAILDVKQQS